LPLINTLRDFKEKEKTENGSTGADKKSKGKAGSSMKRQESMNTSKPAETVPNPPSFYDDDMEKWKKKFHRCQKERDYAKQHINKSCHITC